MFARGRYYNQHGDCNRSQALLAHLQRVCEIGETYGFRFLIWSDMFFKLATGGQYYAQNAQIDESVREKIPANVELIYWDYYSADEAHYDGMIEAHQKLKPSTWFAGGLWKWTGYAPHNGYSMKITKAALASCREHGVQDVFLTMWGDDGGECSPFTASCRRCSMLRSLRRAKPMTKRSRRILRSASVQPSTISCSWICPERATALTTTFGIWINSYCIMIRSWHDGSDGFVR